MKIATAHYWYTHFRGGERVVAEIEELLDVSGRACLFYSRDYAFRKALPIQTSFLQNLPLKSRKAALLPLMPMAVNSLDLSEYDVIVSSESGPIKGVLTAPYQRHFCYVHSPMRYLWDLRFQYLQRKGKFSRAFYQLLLPWLMNHDVISANQPDYFIANSNFVKRRVEKYWGKPADVIHPPVEVAELHGSLCRAKDDYYVTGGALVSYKRFDVVIEAFKLMPTKLLRIFGSGEEELYLRGLAEGHANIEFVGYLTRGELLGLVARARGFVFAGLEDFGIMFVESLALGTPLIVLKAGGVCDIVREAGALDSGCAGVANGLGFTHAEPGLVAEAVRAADAMTFDPAALHETVRRFDRQEFRAQFQTYIEQRL